MIVLDSSALLAIALHERGQERVFAALPEAMISSANLAEVLIVVERKGLDSEQIFGDVQNLGIKLVSTDASHARIAAHVWRAHPRLNLSLGDRLCLALALERGARVLTSDREMATVQLGIHVELFR